MRMGRRKVVRFSTVHDSRQRLEGQRSQGCGRANMAFALAVYGLAQRRDFIDPRTLTLSYNSSLFSTRLFSTRLFFTRLFFTRLSFTRLFSINNSSVCLFQKWIQDEVKPN